MKILMKLGLRLQCLEMCIPPLELSLFGRFSSRMFTAPGNIRQSDSLGCREGQVWTMVCQLRLKICNLPGRFNLRQWSAPGIVLSLLYPWIFVLLSIRHIPCQSVRFSCLSSLLYQPMGGMNDISNSWSAVLCCHLSTFEKFISQLNHDCHLIASSQTKKERKKKHHPTLISDFKDTLLWL